jgi:multiple sugar transport system ATP-binding protein
MQLTCNKLSFQYPNNGTKVLDNLSFTIQGSGFHAVFGPSGAGKTSLARIIAAGISEYQGDLQLTGITTILYCYNLERLPGWTNIGKLLQEITPAGREPLLAELIAVFDLNDLLDSRFPQLSMGQQNRVNLIRYLVQNFDLLILDESLANVDEKLRQSILLHIKERFPDKMFLAISHNLMEIATFCKDIMVLDSYSGGEQGRLLQGMDLRRNGTEDISLDRRKLDAVMLEIMNAC